MDEQGEFFFKAIFWMMAAPFWIAWKVSRFLWVLAVKPAIEHTNHERAERVLGDSSQPPSKNKNSPSVLEQQLEALRRAAPPGLPDKMRATIQLNQVIVPRMERKRVRHLIGNDSFVPVKAGERTFYTVDMLLEMTETERAIIKQHQLDEIVLEDVPFNSEDDILDSEIARDEELKGIRGFSEDAFLQRELHKQVTSLTIDHVKKDRRKTRIGDLLVLPFTRRFDAPHKAKQYSDKLKGEFLPTVKKLLDEYRDYKASETLEF